LAAELFLDDDFSLALRKLLARLRSLLKLLTLLRAGLSALCGVSRGELGGSGERHILGEGDLEMLTVLLMSRRSKGLGDLDTAGVERGESSVMSQYSSLMSGVDCLLLGHEFSSPLSPILLSVFLGGVKEDLGGVRRSLRGGVRLSLVLRPPRTDLLTALENSVTEGFFSVAESLRFWFLSAVLKLSSLCMSVLMTACDH